MAADGRRELQLQTATVNCNCKLQLQMQPQMNANGRKYFTLVGESSVRDEVPKDLVSFLREEW